jgi:hypothetical protein
MSYALTVYLVPKDRLHAVFGKNDAALFEEARTHLADRLANYDQQMDAPDLDTYDVDLSHADALREIFTGQFTPYVNGARYGWAFECLCKFLGEPLSNRGFSPCKFEWYETLDRYLQQHQVSLRFSDLIGDLPLPIPRADDWPCVGHWTADHAAARQQLATLAQSVEDSDAKESFKTESEWLARLADQSNNIIVGFHG